MLIMPLHRVCILVQIPGTSMPRLYPNMMLVTVSMNTSDIVGVGGLAFAIYGLLMTSHGTRDIVAL